MTSSKAKALKPINPAAAPKSEKKGQEGQKSRSPTPQPAEAVQPSESESEEDEEYEGIDEEGMARLMELLGEDALAGSDNEEEEEGESGSEEEGQGAEIEALSDDEDSEEEEGEEDDAQNASDAEDEAEGTDNGENEEIVLDEVDSVDEDAIPRQKSRSTTKLESIKLDPSLPWTETLVLSYPETIDVDVNDDLNRELAFDSHMERIRQRLLNEAAGIKKSEDKRKEREGKKFGKQVQVRNSKIERGPRRRWKRDSRDLREVWPQFISLINTYSDHVLDNPQANDDEFDIAIEDAISDRPAKRGKGANGKSMPRSARDQKFGFGGSTRRSKQNTRESTDNFDATNAGRGRGGGEGGRGGAQGGRGGAQGGRGGKSRHSSKRLGKSKRTAAKGK
ncbi:eukaryotic rRNA processing protein EBP2-domain-containing protein [Gymnopilus junonius]|uniref:Eukaryotic rRNA processing protein EBP2-domain-containing protein n=1 Tax=Gymnopilus junonius TaxID=109634 RepID=A0A9P5NGL3_GYMJU|nr:eukaryotic rRNA processing protein EBP2-domain-containing protein [Gymnopilus junonius]